jgi:hypothetical protein
MPFTIRPYRRFPVSCPVIYHAGLFEGQGIVWNLSVNGWRNEPAVEIACIQRRSYYPERGQDESFRTITFYDCPGFCCCNP